MGAREGESVRKKREIRERERKREKKEKERSVTVQVRARTRHATPWLHRCVVVRGALVLGRGMMRESIHTAAAAQGQR